MVPVSRNGYLYPSIYESIHVPIYVEVVDNNIVSMYLSVIYLLSICYLSVTYLLSICYQQHCIYIADVVVNNIGDVDAMLLTTTSDVAVNNIRCCCHDKNV